jgi:hypothetical protein
VYIPEFVQINLPLGDVNELQANGFIELVLIPIDRLIVIIESQPIPLSRVSI